MAINAVNGIAVDEDSTILGISGIDEIFGIALSAGGGGGGFDVEENFEGAGTPAGFTSASGTPDYDQATTGLSLEASQCLRIDGNANQEEAYVAFTATDSVFAYFMMR